MMAGEGDTSLLPWPKLMVSLIGSGQISAEAFWRLSLPELGLLLGVASSLDGGDRLSRSDFLRLTQAFPDGR